MGLVREEMLDDDSGPKMIMCDYNKQPDTLDSIQELMEEDGWVEAGEVASW